MKDSGIEYQRRWREKNKDKIREYRKRWRSKNIEKIKEKESEYNRIYYINNRDSILKNKLEYQKTEKWAELMRIRVQNRRWKIRENSDWTINYNSTQKILKEQNFECSICFKNIKNRKTRHLDHIMPIAKWWVHSIKNVQWLCCKCNLKKWANIN